ncbi:hypothetical protein B296_00020394 [Ensete ventricosum]|uniref:Uncharacterized protein n=1 Tax=Ensete ventricosum TaxID=4639 RepID=A0A426YLN1_ENSVE|nr:hypothetical protein B296_00020394 [Ensete ventricosum]
MAAPPHSTTSSISMTSPLKVALVTTWPPAHHFHPYHRLHRRKRSLGPNHY